MANIKLCVEYAVGDGQGTNFRNLWAATDDSFKMYDVNYKASLQEA